MLKFGQAASKRQAYRETEEKPMKVEDLNLHGSNIREAQEKLKKSLDWAIKHGVDVLVINHGKGRHSSGGFSVLKAEIRKMLKEDTSLLEHGYRVVYGESDLPIALTYDEGNTLIVARGRESEYIGGRAQQEKNQRIFSEEAKRQRKAAKRQRKRR